MVIKSSKKKFYVLPMREKGKVGCGDLVMVDLKLKFEHPATVQGNGSEIGLHG